MTEPRGDLMDGTRECRRWGSGVDSTTLEPAATSMDVRWPESGLLILSQDASITLVHVAAAEVEAVATGASEGLLGRRPWRAAAPQFEAVSEAEAQDLLELAGKRLGRDA